MSAPRTCWVISDGRRGIENQALGLAECLSQMMPLDIHIHHILHGKVFTALPPKLQRKLKSKPEEYGLPTALPDMVIGCGRQAIAPLLVIKKLAGSSVKTIYVQDPKISPSHFDLVIAPEHDQVSGDNIISMIGSPNRISKNTLKQDYKNFTSLLSGYPKPFAAVLIGGPSKRFKLTQKDMAAWHDAMRDLHEKGYSLLVTPARRTPDFAVKMLGQFAHEYDNVWLHKDGEPNPYFAFLEAADIILVTEDSTNMLTESCATGKPVYRLPMSGEPGKFEKFYASLEHRYGVKRYDGTPDISKREPLNETERVGEKILKRLWD